MDTIRVNFRKAVPLFPLPGVVVLPHARIPLHIFEPRYRQMINRALDEAGQFAMAVFEGDDWREEYQGNPPLRSVVCLAQIVEHESLPQGRYNVLIQGVCRARIVKEISPTQGRLYREALLEPMETEPIEDDTLLDVRQTMEMLIEAEEFDHLASIETLRTYLNDEDIPISALLDVVGVALLNDSNRKYQLLCNADLRERGEYIVGEMQSIGRLIRSASKQDPSTWPKGLSWN
jgi:uncharacterized protein